MNLGGKGCSELKSHHCMPVWVTRAKLRLKKKEREREKRAINEGLLEEMGQIQRQKRTGTFVKGGGRPLHCTRQAQRLAS